MRVMLIKVCMTLGIHLQNRRQPGWFKRIKEVREQKARALINGGTVQLV